MGQASLSLRGVRRAPDSRLDQVQDQRTVPASFVLQFNPVVSPRFIMQQLSVCLFRIGVNNGFCCPNQTQTLRRQGFAGVGEPQAKAVGSRLSKGQEKGIRLTQKPFKLTEQFQYRNLRTEIEARWRLVETAWELNSRPHLDGRVQRRYRVAGR